MVFVLVVEVVGVALEMLNPNWLLLRVIFRTQKQKLYEGGERYTLGEAVGFRTSSNDAIRMNTDR